MSFTPQQISLTVIGLFKIFIFLVFLAIYAFRLHKITKLASNYSEEDHTLKFRAIGIILLVLIKLTNVVLSYVDPGFYLTPNPNYVLIDLLVMVDLLLQIIIVYRQIQRRIRRSRFKLIALWGFMIIIDGVNIAIFTYFGKYYTAILPVIQVPIEFTLIVLTFIKPHVKQITMDDVQRGIKMSRLIPLINKNPNQTQSRQSQKVYIQMNKQFKVSFEGDSFQFFFKIVVFIYGKHHVIQKSESQFIKLSQQLQDIFPQSNDISLNKLSYLANSSNITKCGEEKQRMYEAYLSELVKTDEYFCEPLMNFLQINKIQRQAIQRTKMSMHKQSSIITPTQRPKKRHFFTVTWKNMKINVSNPQIIDIYINKSEDQIVQFHNKLIAQRLLNIQFINQRDDPTQLLNFIDRVVNSKKLWRAFSQWMCLGYALEQKLYNMFDYWNFGFQCIDISIPSFETSFDKSQSVVYYYLISLKNKRSKKITVLRRRYNEFVKLDTNVRKYLSFQNKKNAHTPQLPPKFSPFQSQTSPNTRRLYLDTYLKDLLKMQGINYCIKVLQFLQADKQKQQVIIMSKKEFEMQSRGRSRSVLIESIRFEQLQI